MNLPTPISTIDLLLADHGLGPDLPSGLPLDLARLPIVRPTNVLDEKTRDEEGRFPTEAWETRVEYVDAAGIHYEAVIRGSPTEGLPYGADGDVILATCLLVIEDGDPEGYVRNPSLNRLANALGRELDGSQARRLLEALSRCSSVLIESRIAEVSEAEAGAVLRGEAEPAAPRPVSRRQSRSVKVHLLQADVETEEITLSDGTKSERARIRSLQMSPELIRYAIAGGVAWIDREIFARLSRQPTARALYQFVASEVAHGRPSPWSFSVDELSTYLGLRLEVRPARRLQQLEEAAQVLVEHGVLHSYGRAGKGRATVLTLVRGELLDIARRLRGWGLFDLEDVRKQAILLGILGIHSARARELIRQGSHDLPLVLAYLQYKAETDPNTGEFQNPAGFVVNAIRRGIPYDSDDRFMRWLEGRQLEHLEATTQGQRSTDEASVEAPREHARVTALRAPNAAEVLAGAEDAVALFQRCLPVLREAFARQLIHLLLREVAARRIENHVLHLETFNSYAAEYLQAEVIPHLSRLVSEETRGVVTAASLRHVSPEFEDLSPREEPQAL
jgi:hypothetical protein